MRYHVYQFLDKWILASKFPKSKSGFGINTSNIPCVPIFSQNGQLLILRPKFWEITQLRAILLRVLQRAGWRLKWSGWRWLQLGRGWNELGGGEWSWVDWVEMDRDGWKLVHSLLIPIVEICDLIWHAQLKQVNARTAKTKLSF